MELLKRISHVFCKLKQLGMVASITFFVHNLCQVSPINFIEMPKSSVLASNKVQSTLLLLRW